MESCVHQTAATASSAGKARKRYFKVTSHHGPGAKKKSHSVCCRRGIHASGAISTSVSWRQGSGI
jgi:hypothetical protein